MIIEADDLCWIGLFLMGCYNMIIVGTFILQLVWKFIDDLPDKPGYNPLWAWTLRLFGGGYNKEGNFYFSRDGERIGPNGETDGIDPWLGINLGLFALPWVLCVGVMTFVMTWEYLIAGGLIIGGVFAARIWRRQQKILKGHMENEDIHKTVD